MVGRARARTVAVETGPADVAERDRGTILRSGHCLTELHAWCWPASKPWRPPLHPDLSPPRGVVLTRQCFVPMRGWGPQTAAEGSRQRAYGVPRG